MSEKLISELPGIFNWALEGCREWKDEGLCVPDEVKIVTDNYRTKMDSFKLFISDSCELNSNAKTSVTELYNSYKAWSCDNGFTAIGKIKFGERIIGLGCEQKQAKIDDRVIRAWVGIELKSDEY
jgi:putative DNA primase/helicase